MSDSIQENIQFTFTGEVRPESIEMIDMIRILRSQQKLMNKSADFLFGGKTKVRVALNEIRRGSIEFDSTVQVLGSLQPAFAMLPSASLGISTISGMIKAWLSLSKFLNGKPPITITQTGDGQNVAVTNNSGIVQNINGNLYQTFVMGDVGAAASAFRAPIDAGANGLDLKSNGETIQRYSVSDVESFTPIRPVQDIVTSSIPVLMSVVSPVFEGEGVWRFKFGATFLNAKITDELFLKGVESGLEVFRKGDTFKVDLKTEQKQIGPKIVTSHFVEKIFARI